ncbi:hypothetical protein IJ541_03070 [bacterium]|nr:hypothetical protein [bacterium]
MFDISSPSTYVPAIFLTLIAIFVSFLYKDSKKNTHENTLDLPYYNEILLSMEYIERNILEDGRFQYRKHVNSEITYDNNVYNSLRHAGVLYSMYMYEKYGLTDKFKELRIKASKYFIERYIKKLGKNGKYVVISIPEEEQIKIPIAKSGAAGVALCALSNLYNENLIDLKILQGLGEFIISLQKKDGNIYAYYDLGAKSINKEAEALYYPGEAAAGLLYLYEIDSQEKWLDAAKKIVIYLAKTGKPLELSIPFDHWSALVIEKLFKSNLVTDDERNILRAYVEQMAIPALSDQITNRNNSYYGAFKDNVRPCSLGAIMEGLASIYFCTNNKNLKKVIFKSLSIGNLFLSKVQVKTGEQAGGLPNSANWVKAGVTPNASIIRIDNVQHVVTGWLKFQNILKITGNY